MEPSELRASATIVISAPQEDLYSFIADMPRIGEISPVCNGGNWEGADRGVGATFVGSNTRGDRTWQARMRIAVADPSREFAWDNLGEATQPYDEKVAGNVRWTYLFEPVESGTRVTESWSVLPGSRILEALDDPRIVGLPKMTQESIEETLEGLKQLFEA